MERNGEAADLKSKRETRCNSLTDNDEFPTVKITGLRNLSVSEKFFKMTDFQPQYNTIQYNFHTFGRKCSDKKIFGP